MPRRYKQGADGQPHPAFYGKLPEEFSTADTMRFMVETDLKMSGDVYKRPTKYPPLTQRHTEQEI